MEDCQKISLQLERLDGGSQADTVQLIAAALQSHRLDPERIIYVGVEGRTYSRRAARRRTITYGVDYPKLAEEARLYDEYGDISLFTNPLTLAKGSAQPMLVMYDAAQLVPAGAERILWRAGHGGSLAAALCAEVCFVAERRAAVC